jgi:hypothetical protein
MLIQSTVSIDVLSTIKTRRIFGTGSANSSVNRAEDANVVTYLVAPRRFLLHPALSATLPVKSILLFPPNFRVSLEYEDVVLHLLT